MESMFIKHFDKSKCDGSSDKSSVSCKANLSEAKNVVVTSFGASEHVVRADNAEVSSNDNDKEGTDDEWPTVWIVVIIH